MKKYFYFLALLVFHPLSAMEREKKRRKINNQITTIASSEFFVTSLFSPKLDYVNQKETVKTALTKHKNDIRTLLNPISRTCYSDDPNLIIERNILSFAITCYISKLPGITHQELHAQMLKGPIRLYSSLASRFLKDNTEKNRYYSRAVIKLYNQFNIKPLSEIQEKIIEFNNTSLQNLMNQRSKIKS
jgi:hypothetical protein